MAKTIDLAKLIESRNDLTAELEWMTGQKAPKSMLAKKQKAIDEINSVLAENESQVKCAELMTALEPVKESVAQAVKATGSQFPVNIRFRFENGELSKFTVAASVAGSDSGSGSRSTGTLTFKSGSVFPETVSCNYSAKKEFHSVGDGMPSDAVYKSYKEAATAVLKNIYPDLWKLYESGADNKKYHSASAHDLLNRMIKVNIDDFFTVKGTVNGPASK